LLLPAPVTGLRAVGLVFEPPPASAAGPRATCPNTAAALFTGDRIAHLGRLPQGQPERYQRAIARNFWEAAPTSASAKPSVPKEIKLQLISPACATPRTQDPPHTIPALSPRAMQRRGLD